MGAGSPSSGARSVQTAAELVGPGRLRRSPPPRFSRPTALGSEPQPVVTAEQPEEGIGVLGITVSIRIGVAAADLTQARGHGDDVLVFSHRGSLHFCCVAAAKAQAASISQGGAASGPGHPSSGAAVRSARRASIARSTSLTTAGY